MSDVVGHDVGQKLAIGAAQWLTAHWNLVEMKVLTRLNPDSAGWGAPVSPRSPRRSERPALPEPGSGSEPPDSAAKRKSSNTWKAKCTVVSTVMREMPQSGDARRETIR